VRGRPPQRSRPRERTTRSIECVTRRWLRIVECLRAGSHAGVDHYSAPCPGDGARGSLVVNVRNHRGLNIAASVNRHGCHPVGSSNSTVSSSSKYPSVGKKTAFTTRANSSLFLALATRHQGHSESADYTGLAMHCRSRQRCRDFNVRPLSG